MSDLLGTADLHLHTLASDGLMSAQALLEYAEYHTRLDIIAVTDHDETGAAHEAEALARIQGYRVQVIPGVEVTTRDGHLLALFIDKRPPALRPAVETAQHVMALGGLCVAPHPFTRATHSLGERPMRELTERGLLAGVEVLNASPAGRLSRVRAERFAQANGLAQFGGSDAHVLGVVSLAHTTFPGRSIDDLRRAISARTVLAGGRFADSREIAAEAIPQLARSLIHLPLRRIRRAMLGA